MVDYRRMNIKGGLYFVTITLKNRRSNLLTENIALIRKALKTSIQKYGFKIDSMCVLPDHIHMMIQLHETKDTVGPCIQRFKSEFVKLLKHSSVVIYNQKGEANIWQRRFWEHLIRDESDYRRHLDYIHYNPLKHGLVRDVNDWPFSSYDKFKQMGWYPDNWCQAYICEALDLD